MGRLSMRKFLADQWEPVPPVEPRDLAGKTVLVVGANVGLGFEAAKHFASMKPARLVLACRSLKKGDVAARAIKEATAFDGIYVRQLDLAVFTSVVAFAEAFEAEFKSLDIYVYNAGVFMPAYEQTADGWETTLQVNHLSCMLLTVLLSPSLLSAATPTSRPRAVVVSSDVHFWTKIKTAETESPNLLELYNDEAYCTPLVMRDRYNLSKLLNVLFVRSLTAHLPPDSPLLLAAVNPGFCVSSLRRGWRFPLSLFGKVLEALVARTTEEGARALVWAALGASNREDELRGAYVSDAGLKEASDFVVSVEGVQAQARVWDESVAVLSKVSPRFKELVDAHLSG